MKISKNSKKQKSKNLNGSKKSNISKISKISKKYSDIRGATSISDAFIVIQVSSNIEVQTWIFAKTKPILFISSCYPSPSAIWPNVKLMAGGKISTISTFTGKSFATETHN